MNTPNNDDLQAMVEAAYTRMRERHGHDSVWMSDNPAVRQTLKQQLLDVIHPAAQVLPELGWVKQRTITTVEELDALPSESVVRDRFKVVFERSDSVEDSPWDAAGSDLDYHADDIRLPAVVLFEPEPRP